MLLPLPIIIGWFLAILPSGKINEYSLPRLEHFAPWIGLSLLVLAATIATFIRLRQRLLRVVLLATSGLLTLSVVVYYSTGALVTPTFVGLMLVMWGVFLAPPLLERYLIRNRQDIAWRKDKKTG
jgi:membrane-associated HD superfamily phosphohydrolase